MCIALLAAIAVLHTVWLSGWMRLVWDGTFVLRRQPRAVLSMGLLLLLPAVTITVAVEVSHPPAPPCQYGWYITEDVILAAATGLVDTSRAIKGMPAGTSLRDLGYRSVGMDEGWAACPPKPGPDPHGRDPRVDPRAKMRRQNVTAPFPIGGGLTSM